MTRTHLSALSGATLATLVAASLPAQTATDTPPDHRVAIDSAVAKARPRGKRVIIMWHAPVAGTALARTIQGTKVRGQRFQYEFEFVDVTLDGDAAKSIAQVYRAGDARPWLTVLDGAGHIIAQQSASAWQGKDGIDQKAVATFLEAHKVPMPDAEAVWREGLARAAATNRNVLVHLAAPW